MTLTLSARATIANDGALQRRLRQGLAMMAAWVLEEDPPDAARVALARQITYDPTAWVKRFAIGVANNPNVGTGESDPTDDTSEGDDALMWVIDEMWAMHAPNYGAPAPAPDPDPTPEGE